MFYQKVNKDSNKDMFNFLVNHYTYDTMNSWNGVRSIANKVKLYDLDLRNDWSDANAALQQDDYFTINQMLKDFEEEHPECSVAFNGRSGGYLVLYPEHGVRHIFDSDEFSPVHYNDYEDWKEDVQQFWGSLKAYRSSLLKQVELVQAFDKLCDDLVKAVDDLTDQYLEYEREEKFRAENTKIWSATKHFEEYYYDDIENFNLHKKYMLGRGYSIYEENEDDLYVMYEMHESLEGCVFVDPREEK